VNLSKPFFGGCNNVDMYRKISRIGEGTYGIVYSAKNKETNEIVALKKIRMEKEKDGLPISSLREIALLKSLQHENIINVKDVVVGGAGLHNIFIVMEYCKQDLAYMMDNTKSHFTFSEVKCIMLQLLRGIQYLHKHFIIHRDLKLSNLLITSKGILKIADFGLAKTCGDPPCPMTPNVVTLWYRSPELLLGEKNYSFAVDMWSVGCIFGELLKHRPIMPGNTEMNQLQKIFELLGVPNPKIWSGFDRLPLARNVRFPSTQKYNQLKVEFPHVSDNVIDLLNGLLTYDPQKRFTVNQAIHHKYFKESPWPKSPEQFMEDHSHPPHPHHSSSSATVTATTSSTYNKRLFHQEEYFHRQQQQLEPSPQHQQQNQQKLKEMEGQQQYYMSDTMIAAPPHQVFKLD
jgi:cyclin-dependent kinase 10